MAIIPGTKLSYGPESEDPAPEPKETAEDEPISLGEFDILLAQARRERISRETRAATIGTYGGGAPPRAKGKGEPEPESRDAPESKPADVEKYYPAGDDES